MTRPPAIGDTHPVGPRRNEDCDSVHGWRGDGREATGNRPNPVLHLIDHLLSIETPNMKLLRLNAQIIKRQNEEMGK